MTQGSRSHVIGIFHPKYSAQHQKGWLCTKCVQTKPSPPSIRVTPLPLLFRDYVSNVSLQLRRVLNLPPLIVPAMSFESHGLCAVLLFTALNIQDLALFVVVHDEVSFDHPPLSGIVRVEWSHDHMTLLNKKKYILHVVKDGMLSCNLDDRLVINGRTCMAGHQYTSNYVNYVDILQTMYALHLIEKKSVCFKFLWNLPIAPNWQWVAQVQVMAFISGTRLRQILSAILNVCGPFY